MLTICNFSYFLVWFEGWIWVLIVSVPDLCIIFTFHMFKTFQNTEWKMHTKFSLGSVICYFIVNLNAVFKRFKAFPRLLLLFLST